MVLQGCLEHLARLSNAPDPHETLGTSADDLGAVRRAREGRHRLLVCVVDRVYELPTLGPECSDLAITPSTDDSFAILESEREVKVG